MTLQITRTTRWTAVATVLFFVGHLAGPAAWAQAPSKAAGPAGATASPAPSPGAAKQAPSPAGAPNAPWPREFSDAGRTFTIYQPQIEKWDGTRLHARAAVSVESAASPQEHFGVAWFSARAEVDKVNRL